MLKDQFTVEEKALLQNMKQKPEVFFVGRSPFSGVEADVMNKLVEKFFEHVQLEEAAENEEDSDA